MLTAYEARIAAHERLVGRQALEIDFLREAARVSTVRGVAGAHKSGRYGDGAAARFDIA